MFEDALNAGNSLVDPRLSPKERLAATRILADQGDAEAQYQVGFRYYLGDSGAQDFNAAEKWYTMAAEQGHTEAQYKLGKMKADGRGIDQNFEEAHKWYALAAAKGHSEAMYHLGVLYEHGRGIDEDLIAAYKWYTLSIQAVDADLSAYLEREGLDPSVRGAALAAALEDAELAAELEIGLDRGQASLDGLMRKMAPQAVEAGRLAAATWRREA